MANSKVPLGIFWDIENCPVPSGHLASGVAKQIRDFIADKRPECGYALEFACACDVTRMDSNVIEGLNRNGVVIAHVSGVSKNAADDKLKEMIDMYIDKYFDKRKAVLCVITGDINFANTVRNALRKNLDVVLIHGNSHSSDLKNLVKETYLFGDITSNAEVVLEDNTLKSGMYDGYYSNTGLSQLSANCGGRPESSYGRTVIRFGSKDDAQRCLQRINGQDVYGCKILVGLIEATFRVPAPERLKKGSIDQNIIRTRERSLSRLSQREEWNQLEVDPEVQSVLKGMYTKSTEDVTQRIRALVSGWNDPKVKPESVMSVSRSSKVKDGKHTLFVTAINPEANKALIESGKRHGLKWDQFFDKSELKTSECKSFIRGIFTKQDTNIIQGIKQLVSSWNDKVIRPEFVFNVDRDKKFNGKDGKATLCVTATSPEASKALVTGAKKYLKGKGIHWYYTGPKQESDTSSRSQSVPPNRRNNSMDFDCRSVLKGFESFKDQNVDKAVRNLVKNWNDPNVRPDFIRSVSRDKASKERDGKALLFITATNPQTCAALVSGAQKYLKGDLKWEVYYRRRAFSRASDRSETEPSSPDCEVLDGQDLSSPEIKPDTTETKDQMSGINSKDSKPEENQSKIVREIVMDLNDKAGGQVVPSEDPVLSTPSKPNQKSFLKGIVRGIENLFTPSRSAHKPIKMAKPEPEPESVVVSNFSVTELPFEYVLPNGLTEGQVVRITGRPKPFAKEFQINICRDSDIDLHFSVRMRQSVVICNTRIDGQWVREEKHYSDFPFKFSQPFDLKILVDIKRYVITINGQLFCAYEHRIPSSSVTKMSFIGDLIVDCFRFE